MLVEARRAVEELGAVSVRNPFLPEGRWLHEPEYDALWSLACELDFPISVHGEYRQRRFHPFAGGNRGNVDDRDMQMLALRGLDHALGFPCDNMATMGQFIFTGILERFPKLRLGILESNVGWVPFWLGRMDEHTHGRNSVMGNAVERLPMLPSEYFKRQITVTCDSDESALSYAVEHLGGDNIAWNTDYPHPDAPRPEKALPDLDAQSITGRGQGQDPVGQRGDAVRSPHPGVSPHPAFGHPLPEGEGNLPPLPLGEGGGEGARAPASTRHE